MSTLDRRLYDFKLLLINLLLAGVIVLFNPLWISQWGFGGERFDYTVGLVVLASMLLEYFGLVFERDSIYSRPGAELFKAPGWIQLTFFPRLLVSVGLLTLAFQAMGFLEYHDFFFIPVAVIAAVKELWVRNALLKPADNSHIPNITPLRLWAGGILLFIWLTISYLSIWEIFLLDNPRYLYLIMHPRNYAFVGAIFYVMVVAMEMPFFLEEVSRKAGRRQLFIALASASLPVFALLFRLFSFAYDGR